MVSLILATYNRYEVLKDFLNSLSDCQVLFEIIILDQNHGNILDDLIENYIEMGLDIRHIKLKERNLSLARNHGISISKYNIIGFPDDDCYYEFNTLDIITRHFSILDSDILVGKWVETGYKYYDGILNIQKADVLNFTGIPLSSITLFFRKEIFYKVGGFDERLGVGLWFGAGEETDLIIRSTLMDFKITFDPEVAVHHRYKLESKVNFNLYFNRQKGSGAIYAKNALSKYVIIRGLISPLYRILISFNYIKSVNSLFIFFGRCLGMLVWIYKYGFVRNNSEFCRIKGIY
jgi:GT2 family glycosyltransferase